MVDGLQQESEPDRVLEIRCLPELVQTNGHIAYTVPCLEKELEGKKVIFGPAVCDEHLTIAFIEEEGIAIEIMELK